MLIVTRDDIDVSEQGGGVLRGNLKHKTAYVESGKLAITFDGVDTALRYVKTNMPKAQQHRSSVDKGSSSGRGFHAFETYSEALETFLEHPERIRDFSEKDLKLGGGDSAGLKLEYGVTGDFIDIDRYLSGEPDCFGSLVNGQPRGQRANIVLNNSWPSQVKAGDVQQRSKRILRLIDWLEQQGIRCKITAVESSDQQHVETAVKQFDQPLDINAVAIVSHPEWLRRIMFRVAEHSPDLAYGYGHAIEFERHVLRNPETVQSDDKSAINIFVGNGRNNIDDEFDDLEERIASLLDETADRHEIIKLAYDQQPLLLVNLGGY
jgi:hypothetical protein